MTSQPHIPSHSRTSRRIGGVVLGILAASLLLGAGQPEPTKPSRGPAPSSVSVSEPKLYDCISRPSDFRELGFSVRGKVANVLIKPGDVVKAGQPLVRLDDEVQKHTVEYARLQATDLAQVQMGEAQVRYREKEVELLANARDRDAGNDSQMREAQFRLDSSRLELEAARTRTKLNEASLRREQAQLDAMGISAPLNGVVLDVRKRAGETVDEGSPVLTIVSVDPLWLDVSVPIREATGISVGQSAEVIWEDIDDKTPMTAHVIYKAPAGNAGARKIQLRLEVPNPNQIPSGMHGSLRFRPAGSSSAPSGTADAPGTKMGGK